ncbi:MAG: cytidylyltransferase domain-containing protein, partial [Verrucomicrobiales bacterium]
MMKPVCIIPARGGSKGLPRKNVLPLCGHPLLSWTVIAAVEALGNESVFVTTDDEEIVSVAERYGARVIRRPAELAGDTATSESALEHALCEVRARDGHLPEAFVFVQATSPLTTSADIRLAIERLEEAGVDSLFSGVRSHRFLWRYDDLGDARGINHDSRERLRRQDRDPEVAENGAIYV